MIWVYKPHAHRAHVIDAEPRPAPSILLLPQARKTLCGSSIIGTVHVRTAEIGGDEPAGCATCNEKLTRQLERNMGSNKRVIDALKRA